MELGSIRVVRVASTGNMLWLLGLPAYEERPFAGGESRILLRLVWDRAQAWGEGHGWRELHASGLLRENPHGSRHDVDAT